MIGHPLSRTEMEVEEVHYIRNDEAKEKYVSQEKIKRTGTNAPLRPDDKAVLTIPSFTPPTSIALPPIEVEIEEVLCAPNSEARKKYLSEGNTKRAGTNIPMGPKDKSTPIFKTFPVALPTAIALPPAKAGVEDVLCAPNDDARNKYMC